MASKKHAKKQAESAVPYIRRLLEDEYVQEQLRSAASGLRAVYQRASRQGGQAAEDKRLYANLRQAATSVRRATTALQRPKPAPKHRGRKIAIMALIGGGGAVLIIKRRKSEPEAVSDSGVSAPQPSGPEKGADGSQHLRDAEHAQTPTSG
jgi:hypothetical protein